LNQLIARSAQLAAEVGQPGEDDEAD
jgi:hypothetical protein